MSSSVLVKGRFKSVIQLLEANEIFHSVASLWSLEMLDDCLKSSLESLGQPVFDMCLHWCSISTSHLALIDSGGCFGLVLKQYILHCCSRALTAVSDLLTELLESL